MPQPNVFDNTDNGATPPPQSPPADTLFSNQLSSIKAEDGRQKYDTVEKALEALAHSQAFIPELQTKVNTSEAEIATLRTELAARQSLEDLLKRQQGDPTPPDVTPPGQNGISETDIAKIVANQLEQRTQDQVVTENASKVNSALVAKFGDKAQEVVINKAKELGMTPEQLGEMAKNQPNVVLSLFGQAAPAYTPPTSGGYRAGFPDIKPEPLARPEKSLLAGATESERSAFMAKIREEVYKKYDVTE